MTSTTIDRLNDIYSEGFFNSNHQSQKFCLFYVDENIAWAQILSLPHHPVNPKRQPHPLPTLLLSLRTRQNKILDIAV